MGFAHVDRYTGFTGPTSFGSGVIFLPTLAAETLSAFSDLFRAFVVPQGYVSGRLYRIA